MGVPIPLLHLHGQRSWHDDAYIVGTAAGLRALAVALLAALANGEGQGEMTATDGEHYDLHVIRVDESQQDDLALPYTDEYAKEIGLDVLWPWMLLKEKED